MAPGADPLKTAILSGIIVAGELFRERDEPRSGMGQAEAEEASRIADLLIRRLAESLGESP